MTQQMGSTSGTAPAARESEVVPGGASDLRSESTDDAVPGGASGITVAERQPPASSATGGPATGGLATGGPATEGLATAAPPPEGPPPGTPPAEALLPAAPATAGKPVARRRRWLRRTPPATAG